MSENKFLNNSISMEKSKVEKMKETKLRNRELRLLKKQNTVEAKQTKQALLKEKRNYTANQKAIQQKKLKEKLDDAYYLKQNYYNPSQDKLKKSREERINASLAKLNIAKSRHSTDKTNTKFYRQALNGSFKEVTITNEEFTYMDNYGFVYINKPLIVNLIVHELTKSLYLNNGFNLLANVIIKYSMKSQEEGELDFYYFSQVVEKISSSNQIREWAVNEVNKFEVKVEEQKKTQI